MIVSNQARCKKCGDTPFSMSRHHYQPCKCGSIAVDGGMDYIRRTYTDINDIEELSIIMPKEVIYNLLEAIAWAEETGRNKHGMLFAILRALRDAGYDLNTIGE